MSPSAARPLQRGPCCSLQAAWKSALPLLCFLVVVVVVVVFVLSMRGIKESGPDLGSCRRDGRTRTRTPVAQSSRKFAPDLCHMRPGWFVDDGRKRNMCSLLLERGAAQRLETRPPAKRFQERRSFTISCAPFMCHDGTESNAPVADGQRQMPKDRRGVTTHPVNKRRESLFVDASMLYRVTMQTRAAKNLRGWAPSGPWI
ncbi:uncharacterized protein IWZ02DRAFT_156107 [Phyllosticta citriasiana]|uniref:uncharacterized protein n=1 Tax=Phyllosticta citriasiana TaxID=595635 RepID=UPI0030FD536B